MTLSQVLMGIVITVMVVDIIDVGGMSSEEQVKLHRTV